MSPKSIALKGASLKKKILKKGALKKRISSSKGLRKKDTTVYYSNKTGLPITPKPVAKVRKSNKPVKNHPRKSYKSLIKSLFSAGKNTKLKLTESDLINAESALGATLFGPIPKGHRREFFRFKHNVWIYHESWIEDGKKFESTITYEVRENGVYKLPLGGEYIKLKGRELENFCKAAAEYLKLIKTKLY